MTCSSHSDRRGDSGLLVGQVCGSGQLCPCQDAGPWKVLESVAAGRAQHLNRTGVGFASSCFFTDMLNASSSRGPRSAQRVWPHTGHLHTHGHMFMPPYFIYHFVWPVLCMDTVNNCDCIYVKLQNTLNLGQQTNCVLNFTAISVYSLDSGSFFLLFFTLICLFPQIIFVCFWLYGCSRQKIRLNCYLFFSIMGEICIWPAAMLIQRILNGKMTIKHKPLIVFSRFQGTQRDWAARPLQAAAANAINPTLQFRTQSRRQPQFISFPVP